MNVTDLLNNVSYGALTPKAHGLVYSPMYKAGCELLHNFIPLKTGGFRARPGSKYTAGITGVARIIPFYDADGDVFIFVCQDTTIQPYDTDTFATVGSPLTTPFTTAQLREFQYSGISTEMMTVHRSHAPRRITYSGGTFAIATPTFTGDRTFAASNKYPGVCAFHKGRFFSGSSNDEPLAMFGSEIPDKATGATSYLGFDFGDGTSADAIYLLESDMNAKRLAFIGAHRRVVTGTNKSTWQSDGSIPTPASFDMDIAGRNGAAEIQPVVLGDLLLYVGYNKKSLRGMFFSDEAGGYVDIDISELADHLLKPGIVDLSVMKNPQEMAIMTMEDGTQVTATIRYGGGQVVAGFSSHSMGGSGLVESTCVAEKDTGDQVWMIVNRSGTRTLEYYILDDIGETTLVNQYYVDCGLSLTPASATVTGLGHLEGLDVAALGDGGVLPEKTVASGQVTYNRSIDVIQIGLAYDSMFRSLRPEIQAQGTSQGKLKRNEQVTLRLYRSLGGYIGVDPNDLKHLLYRKYGVDLYGEAVELFTDDYIATIHGSVDRRGQFYLYRQDPLPLNVLALMPRIAVMEV